MRATAVLVVLCALIAAPALAVGPVDGEFNALWWANDADVDMGGAGTSESADAPGFRAELWGWERYGFRASQFRSDIDVAGLSDEIDYTSIDLMWKAFAPTEHNFVAVGAGYEEMDLGVIGLDGDTSGVRVLVEGRVGLVGALYGYGQVAYLPELGDTSSTTPGMEFEDMDGYEYELGVSWKFMPMLSMRAGYRETSIDFTATDGVTDANGSAESTGFLAGLGIHF